MGSTFMFSTSQTLKNITFKHIKNGEKKEQQKSKRKKKSLLLNKNKKSKMILNLN